MKKVIGIICILFLLGAVCVPAFAGSTTEWLKGNDTEDPLMVSLYVAKTFDVKNEKAPDVRVKFERKNNVGSFDDAEYIASVGLEF